MTPTVAEVEALRIYYSGGNVEPPKQRIASIVSVCDFWLAAQRAPTVPREREPAWYGPTYTCAAGSTPATPLPGDDDNTAGANGPSQEGAGGSAGTSMSAEDVERLRRLDQACAGVPVQRWAAARIEALSAEVATMRDVNDALDKRRSEHLARAEDAERALRSIAANTCCGPCQEAANVARAALIAATHDYGEYDAIAAAPDKAMTMNPSSAEKPDA